MLFSTAARRVLYFVSLSLVASAGWNADFSITSEGHLTAPYVNAILTRLLLAALAWTIASAARKGESRENNDDPDLTRARNEASRKSEE